MAGNEVQLTFTGDSKGLDRTFDNVGKGAKDMASDLDNAGRKAKDFDGKVKGVESGLGNATGKLRSTNDLVGGFASVVGLSLPPQADMILGFADMADGLGGLLGPALSSAKTGFAAMNATMKANPILTVVGIIALLVGALVLAYNKSETFRKIVDGAFKGVVTGAKVMWEGIKKYFDFITGIYKAVFNGIASAWNNTIGRLSFKIPGWVPGIGGNGFDVPDIPTFAHGGRYKGGPMIVGERGPELLVPNGGGTVIPNNRLGGGTTVIRFEGDGAVLDLIRRLVRVEGGGDTQLAFGR